MGEIAVTLRVNRQPFSRDPSRVLLAPGLVMLLLFGCARRPSIEEHRADLGTFIYPVRMACEAAEPLIIKHAFTVQNRANRVVRIERVRKSCACLSANVNRRVLQPGEVAQLELSYTPGIGSRGPDSLYADLFLSDGRVARYVVTLAVFPRVHVEPSYLSGGRLRPGTKREFEVTVDVYGTSDSELLELSRAEAKLWDVSVTPGELSMGRVPGVVGKRYRVALSGPRIWAVGPQQDWLRIAFPGSEHEHVVDVPISWYVEPAVHVTPQKLVLSPASPQGTVTIEPAKGQALGEVRVVSAEGVADAGFRITLQRLDNADDSAYRLLVDARSVQAPTVGSYRIELATGVPDQPTVLVEVFFVPYRRQAEVEVRAKTEASHD